MKNYYPPFPETKITKRNIQDTLAKKDIQYSRNLNDSMGPGYIAGMTALDLFPSALEMGANMIPGQQMAYGGELKKYMNGGQVPVEVEGGEAFETPNGDVGMFQGPSHENGGIPIALPEGTTISSKRVKIDGVSIADRKKKRTKKRMSLEDLLEKSNDKLVQNALEKTISNNNELDEQEKDIQQTVANALDIYEQPEGQSGLPKHELDPIVGDDSWMFEDPETRVSYRTWKKNSEMYGTDSSRGEYNKMYGLNSSGLLQKGGDYLSENKSGIPTLGDTVGLIGQGISAYSGLKNTLAARASDTPNINPYEDFGKEGLDTLNKSKKYLKASEAEALRKADLQKAGLQQRMRNSSRGVNTQRALDISSERAFNRNTSDIQAKNAQLMASLLGQEAGMQNQIDQVVMGGEAQKDLANRQDKDNYYTQMGIAKENQGYGLQNIGNTLNSIKGRNESKKLIAELERQNKSAGEIKAIMQNWMMTGIFNPNMFPGKPQNTK